MKNSVETLIAHYEKLSKEDKDVFENEIEKKKNEYKNKYFSNIYKSRKKRVESATAERKKELDKMESEIPVMLKKAYKEIEFLLNYATYEGRILRMWEYDGDCVFNRTDKEDFMYKSSYHNRDGKWSHYYIEVLYSRKNGFTFEYECDDTLCTYVTEQYEAVCHLMKFLDEKKDEIVKDIDDEIEKIIKAHRKADRTAKQSCYKVR